MRNHLHPLMTRKTSRDDAKPLAGRAGWVYDLGQWSGSKNRITRGLKAWAGVGGSGEWGCAEIACEDQVPYVSRKERPVDGDALEEEIGEYIWKGDRARNFEAMRYGRARFQAILGEKYSIKGFMRGERMHEFGGIVLDASCGVWWMGGTALVNGVGFFSVG